MGAKKKSRKEEKKQDITSVTRKMKYENKPHELQLRNRGIQRRKNSGRGRNSKSLESPTSIKKVKLSSNTNMTVRTSIKKKRGSRFARKKLVSVLANKKGTKNPRRGTIRKCKEIRKSSKTTNVPAKNLAGEKCGSNNHLTPPKKRKVHHFGWTQRKSKRAVLKSDAANEKSDPEEMTPNLARRLRSRATKSSEVSFDADSDTDTGNDSKAKNSKSSKKNIMMKYPIVSVKILDERQISAAATIKNELDLEMEVDVKESDCDSSDASDSDDEKFFNEHFHPPPPPIRKIDFNNLDKLYL